MFAQGPGENDLIPKVIVDKSKKKDNHIVFSLVSQSKHHIGIEIIKDMNALEPLDSDFLKCYNTQEQSIGRKMTLAYRRVMTSQNTIDKEFDYKTNKAHKLSYNYDDEHEQPAKSSLEFFVNISLKEELHNSSEVGWVNQHQLILTLNNDFYLVNLKSKEMVKSRNFIRFGTQQVNMNTFCSIVRQTQDNQQSLVSSVLKATDQARKKKQNKQLQ